MYIVQGCNNHVNRESTRRMFVEKRLEVLVVTDSKLEGSDGLIFSKVRGRFSGVVAGKAMEELRILVIRE